MREDRDTWFDFETMARNEKDDEPTAWDQENRPHLFVRKLRRRATGFQTITPGNAQAHNLTVEEFTSIHAAAEFAAYSQMCLDVHVTLDFAKLGVFDPGEVKSALSRFVRCYSAWCADHYLPAGWISCIEMSKALTYHAHVVLFVPGYSGPEPELPVVTFRRQFRIWARTWARNFAKRNGVAHVPSALRVRGGRKESWVTHWILTTYLMKGFDRNAVLCSARNSPDGMCIRLGDVIPWPYCDPGPVALNRRIGVCENLGPSRRQFGAPKGFEPNLPRETIEQELADDPFAERYFSELLRRAIDEAQAMFDHPGKQYVLFKELEEQVASRTVDGLPERIASNKHAAAYFGLFRLVVGDSAMVGAASAAFEDMALKIDQIVTDAIAENSLNPHNIEAAIRKAVLPLLFGLVGLDQAKVIADRIVEIVRIGLSRGNL